MPIYKQREKTREGVKEVNIGAVDMNIAIAGASVAVTNAPRPQGDSSQTQQSSGRGAAANSEELKRMVGKMQDQIDSMNVSLQYSTYGDNGEKIAVTIVNKETGQVVREIPAKELQDMYTKMSQLAGMIFNKKI